MNADEYAHEQANEFEALSGIVSNSKFLPDLKSIESADQATADAAKASIKQMILNTYINKYDVWEKRKRGASNGMLGSSL